MEQIEDLQVMLEQMPSPAFFVKSGTVTHVNRGAQSLTICPGTPIDALLDTGHTEYTEYRDGCLYLSLSLGGTSCAASVTRVKGYDYFVLEQDEDLAELQSMALAAQELRNPLASVMTVADRLFPMTAQNSDPATKNQVARINRGLFQMLRIVSNMSDAYRYSLETAPTMEIRDITAILQELFDTSAPLLAHTETELRFTNLPQSVYTLVDAEKLERAVHNILSNALKFSPRGTPIDARLTRRGNMLYLTVQNSAGNAKALGNAYHQYQRRPGMEDGRFGVGLGMVLIRRAASVHGGTVLLEQSEEHGTRITMSLALRQNSEAILRSSILSADYAGERDHALLELADSLPPELYSPEHLN